MLFEECKTYFASTLVLIMREKVMTAVAKWPKIGLKKSAGVCICAVCDV